MKEKSTGIIRRFDNLGRIVIPKETRKALHLHEGDLMEISVSGQTIHLEKYEQLDSLTNVSQVFLRAYSTTCSGGVCIICNTEHVIATRGISLSDKPTLSSMVRECILKQSLYVSEGSNSMSLFEDRKYKVEALYPIGIPENPLGAVLLLQYRKATHEEMTSAKLIATMLTELLLP